MIASSRAYIKAQIQKCNSDYKEIVDVFNDDDIAISEVKNGYKVSFGDLTSNYDGNFNTDVVDVSLEVYKTAKQGQELGDFDGLYDFSISIKNTLLDPLIVKNEDSFSDIIWLGLSPEPLPTNDRAFKILLTFQIRKDFDYQGI